MDAEQPAEKNVEYAPMFWVMDWFCAVVVFVQRLDHFSTRLGSRPVDVLGIVIGALTLAYCFMPMLVGRSFKRRLKDELEKGSLSMRTFDICNWGIAQLLFFSYMGMLLFGFRS